MGKGAGSVSEDPSRAAWLRQARSHLRQADPVLARLIDSRPDFDPRAWLAQLPLMDLCGVYRTEAQALAAARAAKTRFASAYQRWIAP